MHAARGCTSVVRGSHRLSPLGIAPNTLFDFDSAGFSGGNERVSQHEEGYRRENGFAGSALGRTEEAGYAPTRMMPNHVKFAARAGDCCIFDLATCTSSHAHSTTTLLCTPILRLDLLGVLWLHV